MLIRHQWSEVSDRMWGLAGLELVQEQRQQLLVWRQAPLVSILSAIHLFPR
jgi:hypothetical protein